MVASDRPGAAAVSIRHRGWSAGGGGGGERGEWGGVTQKAVVAITQLRAHAYLASPHLISTSAPRDLDPFYRCKVHEGSVRELQFDATRIVSAGTDCNVVVTDITSGEAVQRLRGHAGPILAVAFDQVKILSSSADNTLRHWEWGTVGGSKVDKLHVWDNGDNLAKISKKYDVSIPNLIKWNAIKSSAKMYAGQRLVVQKGDPLSLTKAEQEEENRKQKALTRSKNTKTARESLVDEAKLFHSMENFEEELQIHILEPKVLTPYA